jgi:hypothetical protein
LIALAGGLAMTPAAAGAIEVGGKPSSPATTAAPAPAGPTDVGLGLTPATVEQDLKQRNFEMTYTVFNQQATPQTVDLSITALAHDLDGNPSYGGPAPAAAGLRLSETHVVLAAGERHPFRLGGTVPAGVGGLDVGVVATLVQPVSNSAAVEVHSRVGALLLLRGPKPWKESLATGAIEVAPARAGAKPELLAYVRNTGDVHQRPTGTIRVVRDGRPIGTATLDPQLILPGSGRRLHAVWDGAAADLDGATFDVAITNASTQLTSAPNAAKPGSVASPATKGGALGGVSKFAQHVPWWLALLFLLMAIALFLFVLWRRRRRDHKDEAAAVVQAAAKPRPTPRPKVEPSFVFHPIGEPTGPQHRRADDKVSA